MALLWDPAAVLNVVSGVLMGTLGTALLVSRPDRDWNRLFGLLAVFWGIQIVAANAVRLTDDAGQALLAGKLTLAFLIPLYFFVVSFVSIFPEPRAPFGTSPLAVAVLALPAGAALSVLFVQPELLLSGVSQTADGSWTLNWGPVLPYLVTAPFFGSLSYAVYVMMRRLQAARSPRQARQVGAVLGALGLFMAYSAPRHLAVFGGAALGLGEADEVAGLETWLIAAIMLATVAILVGVVVGLVRRLRESACPARRPARTGLGLIGLGLAAAAVTETLPLLGGPELDLLGLVRSGSVAIVVYAIARYQLFDLELRAKRWSASGAAALAVGALAAAAYLGLRSMDVGLLANATATTLVAAVAALPALHASFRLADRIAPDVSSEGEQLYLRKLEVYRAAVDRKRERGHVDRDDPELVELRERLGLEARDHGVVATLAEPGREPAGPELGPGEEVFGKYELEDVIAEGGFGRVLRARDTMLGRRVVIKELLARWREDEAVARRFLQEARIAGQLDHPRVVSVYAIEEHGGDHFLVMEYVPGGTLGERLEAGPLTPEEAVRVTDQVLDALQAAHEQGIVHRDVKPDNVLFDADDQVKLADFGIAHLTRRDAEETIAGLEDPGTQPGTVAYMSPEQAEGRSVDKRSDVYSVGALLYRCLTGRPPVEVADEGPLVARQRVADAGEPDLAGVPEALQPVLAQALATDPDERFASARAFRQALATGEASRTSAATGRPDG
jgi:tRNA A-37 threonylcarbamoyl transferase component Bud32